MSEKRTRCKASAQHLSATLGCSISPTEVSGTRVSELDNLNDFYTSYAATWIAVDKIFSKSVQDPDAAVILQSLIDPQRAVLGRLNQFRLLPSFTECQSRMNTLTQMSKFLGVAAKYDGFQDDGVIVQTFGPGALIKDVYGLACSDVEKLTGFAESCRIEAKLRGEVAKFSKMVTESCSSAVDATSVFLALKNTFQEGLISVSAKFVHRTTFSEVIVPTCDCLESIVSLQSYTESTQQILGDLDARNVFEDTGVAIQNDIRDAKALIRSCESTSTAAFASTSSGQVLSLLSAMKAHTANLQTLCGSEIKRLPQLARLPNAFILEYAAMKSATGLEATRLLQRIFPHWLRLLIEDDAIVGVTNTFGEELRFSKSILAALALKDAVPQVVDAAAHAMRLSTDAALQIARDIVIGRSDLSPAVLLSFPAQVAVRLLLATWTSLVEGAVGSDLATIAENIAIPSRPRSAQRSSSVTQMSSPRREGGPRPGTASVSRKSDRRLSAASPLVVPKADAAQRPLSGSARSRQIESVSISTTKCKPRGESAVRSAGDIAPLLKNWISTMQSFLLLSTLAQHETNTIKVSLIWLSRMLFVWEKRLSGIQSVHDPNWVREPRIYSKDGVIFLAFGSSKVDLGHEFLSVRGGHVPTDTTISIWEHVTLCASLRRPSVFTGSIEALHMLTALTGTSIAEVHPEEISPRGACFVDGADLWDASKQLALLEILRYTNISSTIYCNNIDKLHPLLQNEACVYCSHPTDDDNFLIVFAVLAVCGHDTPQRGADMLVSWVSLVRQCYQWPVQEGHLWASFESMRTRMKRGSSIDNAFQSCVDALVSTAPFAVLRGVQEAAHNIFGQYEFTLCYPQFEQAFHSQADQCKLRFGPTEERLCLEIVEFLRDSAQKLLVLRGESKCGKTTLVQVALAISAELSWPVQFTSDPQQPATLLLTDKACDVALDFEKVIVECRDSFPSTLLNQSPIIILRLPFDSTHAVSAVRHFCQSEDIPCDTICLLLASQWVKLDTFAAQTNCSSVEKINVFCRFLKAADRCSSAEDQERLFIFACTATFTLVPDADWQHFASPMVPPRALPPSWWCSVPTAGGWREMDATLPELYRFPTFQRATYLGQMLALSGPVAVAGNLSTEVSNFLSEFDQVVPVQSVTDAPVGVFVISIPNLATLEDVLCIPVSNATTVFFDDVVLRSFITTRLIAQTLDAAIRTRDEQVLLAVAKALVPISVRSAMPAEQCVFERPQSPFAFSKGECAAGGLISTILSGSQPRCAVCSANDLPLSVQAIAECVPSLRISASFAEYKALLESKTPVLLVVDAKIMSDTIALVNKHPSSPVVLLSPSRPHPRDEQQILRLCPLFTVEASCEDLDDVAHSIGLRQPLPLELRTHIATIQPGRLSAPILRCALFAFKKVSEESREGKLAAFSAARQVLQRVKTLETLFVQKSVGSASEKTYQAIGENLQCFEGHITYLDNGDLLEPVRIIARLVFNEERTLRELSHVSISISQPGGTIVQTTALEGGQCRSRLDATGQATINAAPFEFKVSCAVGHVTGSVFMSGKAIGTLAACQAEDAVASSAWLRSLDKTGADMSDFSVPADISTTTLASIKSLARLSDSVLKTEQLQLTNLTSVGSSLGIALLQASLPPNSESEGVQLTVDLVAAALSKPLSFIKARVSDLCSPRGVLGTRAALAAICAEWLGFKVLIESDDCHQFSKWRPRMATSTPYDGEGTLVINASLTTTIIESLIQAEKEDEVDHWRAISTSETAMSENVKQLVSELALMPLTEFCERVSEGSFLEKIQTLLPASDIDNSSGKARRPADRGAVTSIQRVASLIKQSLNVLPFISGLYTISLEQLLEMGCAALKAQTRGSQSQVDASTKVFGQQLLGTILQEDRLAVSVCLGVGILVEERGIPADQFGQTMTSVRLCDAVKTAEREEELSTMSKQNFQQWQAVQESSKSKRKEHKDLSDFRHPHMRPRYPFMDWKLWAKIIALSGACPSLKDLPAAFQHGDAGKGSSRQDRWTEWMETCVGALPTFEKNPGITPLDKLSVILALRPSKGVSAFLGFVSETLGHDFPDPYAYEDPGPALVQASKISKNILLLASPLASHEAVFQTVCTAANSLGQQTVLVESAVFPQRVRSMIADAVLKNEWVLVEDCNVASDSALREITSIKLPSTYTGCVVFALSGGDPRRAALFVGLPRVACSFAWSLRGTVQQRYRSMEAQELVLPHDGRARAVYVTTFLVAAIEQRSRFGEWGFSVAAPFQHSEVLSAAAISAVLQAPAMSSPWEHFRRVLSLIIGGAARTSEDRRVVLGYIQWLLDPAVALAKSDLDSGLPLPEYDTMEGHKESLMRLPESDTTEMIGLNSAVEGQQRAAEVDRLTAFLESCFAYNSGGAHGLDTARTALSQINDIAPLLHCQWGWLRDDATPMTEILTLEAQCLRQRVELVRQDIVTAISTPDTFSPLQVGRPLPQWAGECQTSSVLQFVQHLLHAASLLNNLRSSFTPPTLSFRHLTKPQALLAALQYRFSKMSNVLFCHVHASLSLEEHAEAGAVITGTCLAGAQLDRKGKLQELFARELPWWEQPSTEISQIYVRFSTNLPIEIKIGTIRPPSRPGTAFRRSCARVVPWIPQPGSPRAPSSPKHVFFALMHVKGGTLREELPLECFEDNGYWILRGARVVC